MSTTLINELMMAADAWAYLANLTIPGLLPEASRQLHEERMARASRLRQRAAWVRKLMVDCEGLSATYALDRLTGPIPAAETAPSERTDDAKK